MRNQNKIFYYNKGIEWIHPETKQVCRSNIRVHVVIADAPARAKILNATQFNSENGFETCEIQTTSLVIGKKKDGTIKNVRIYKPVRNVQLRSEEGRKDQLK